MDPINYPTGTKLKDINHFDRSDKVLFHCPEHPEYKFRSKDPFVSSIFPGDEVTGRAEFLMVQFCRCPIGDHVTSEPYTS